MNKSNIETVDSRWNWLYKLGGAAAAIIAVVIPIQIIVFMAWPPPLAGTASDWFILFQHSKFIGLLNLDLLIVVDNVLGIAIVLALYVVLRRSSESFMAIAALLSLVGTAAYFASNTAFNMLSLSDQYAAATTDAQRAIFLAAGQAMLAISNGTAFQVSYILGSVAPVIISMVMLRSRSRVFSRTTAYMGILANVIAFGLYVPAIGIFISIFSVLFLEIWYILIARQLVRLGRLEGKLLLQPA